MLPPNTLNCPPPTHSYTLCYTSVTLSLYYSYNLIIHIQHSHCIRPTFWYTWHSHCISLTFSILFLQHSHCIHLTLSCTLTVLLWFSPLYSSNTLQLYSSDTIIHFALYASNVWHHDISLTLVIHLWHSHHTYTHLTVSVFSFKTLHMFLWHSQCTIAHNLVSGVISGAEFNLVAKFLISCLAEQKCWLKHWMKPFLLSSTIS